MSAKSARVERLRALLRCLRQRWGFPVEPGKDTRDLARRLGVSANRVWRWECDPKTTRITEKPIRDLATGIGLNPEALTAYLDGEIELPDLAALIPLGELEGIIVPIKTLSGRELEQVLDVTLLALRQEYGAGGVQSAIARGVLRLLPAREALLFWRRLGDIIFADPVESPTIQGLILGELGAKDRPWSDSDQPLRVFESEALLAPGRSLAILSGQRPTPAEVGCLARILSHADGTPWEVHELCQLVDAQYQNPLTPSDKELETNGTNH